MSRDQSVELSLALKMSLLSPKLDAITAIGDRILRSVDRVAVAFAPALRRMTAHVLAYEEAIEADEHLRLDRDLTLLPFPSFLSQRSGESPEAFRERREKADTERLSAADRVAAYFS